MLHDPITLVQVDDHRPAAAARRRAQMRVDSVVDLYGCKHGRSSPDSGVVAGRGPGFDGSPSASAFNITEGALLPPHIGSITGSVLIRLFSPGGRASARAVQSPS